MSQVRVWEFPQDFHFEICPLGGTPTDCDWSKEKGHVHYAEQYGKDQTKAKSRREFDRNALQWMKAVVAEEV
jgi:hypothetical protein